MVAKKFVVGFVLAVTILVMVPLACAQGLGLFGAAAGTSCGAACDPCGQGFWLGLGVRQYFSSFTSFEHPINLLVPGAQGKTRCEWPLDQLYGVVKVGYTRGSIGIVLDYMAPFSSGGGLKPQETFWDVNGDITLVGKGKGKPRGDVFDLGITYALPMGSSSCEEPAFGIAAVVGFRKQNYRYTMTDLDESNVYGTFSYFPGAVEQFTQSYTHWYIGGILTKGFDLGSFMKSGGCYEASYPFVFAFQADYAYVTGKNSLDDFVRYNWAGTAPQVWTNLQDTTGSCWHLNASLAMNAGQCLKVVFEGDFKRIDTRGSQSLDYYYGGAVAAAIAASSDSRSKVWSDQAYLGVYASYGF